MAKRPAKKSGGIGAEVAESASIESTSWFASGLLKSCSLMREKQRIVVLDDSNGICVLTPRGELLAQRRAPKEVIALATDDVGERLAAASRTGEIWWLDDELQIQHESRILFVPIAAAMDSHGNYLVVAGADGRNVLIDREGRKVSEFQARTGLTFLTFNPVDGAIVGADEQGYLCSHRFDGALEWETRHGANIGGLAIDGDGSTILLACFAHGLARYGGDGKKHGVYRYEHAPAMVCIDYQGSRIITASLERTLTELTYEGTLRGSRILLERPIAMALDALGRYLVLGFAHGEVKVLPLPDFFQSNDARSRPSREVASSPGEIAPIWETRISRGLDETSTIVMCPVMDQPRLVLIDHDKRLRIVDEEGKWSHDSESLSGSGRAIVTGKTWLAALTDREIVAFDPVANRLLPCRDVLIEISHLELLEPFGEALIVESGEYISRVCFPEEERWKERLAYRAESVACGADGAVAIALEDHNLLVLDANGKRLGKYRPRPAEAMSVVSLDQGWATSARQSAVIRGHDVDGSLLWSSSLPWAPWGLKRLGRFLLVTNADGKSLLMDQEGAIIEENKEPREGAMYFVLANGEVGRIFTAPGTVIVSSFGGRPLWRLVDEHKIGEVAASAAGIWIVLGRLLSFFTLPTPVIGEK